MTRKLQKAIIKEGRRRSPRITAMEAWQTHGPGSGSGSAGDPVAHSESKGKNASNCTDKTRSHLDNDQGPAFRTRGRKKRKLRPVEELTASSSVLSPPKQGRKQSDDEDIRKKSDQPSNLPSATFMPEKRILELVLNILQRRDIYEIFAEPVDPKEVEDYYEIIEEPMDFGTMRAKLHEGMYKSLEQFEHDVFLIFNNAMHFNSSGTIYFRQARTINELAKKVFNVLKANPEKFESEFSETRQRAGRRNQGNFRDSANVKLSESTVGMSSKTMPSTSHATSNRKSFKSNHGRSDTAKHARDLEDPMGTKDSGRYNKSLEIDRRCTYKPSISLGEDETVFPTVYGKLKQLEHVNQQDIGYRESLMLFVKDLGEAAQNVVRRKLFGCEIHTASTSAPLRPNTLKTDTALNETRRSRDSTNLEIDCEGERVYVSDCIDHAKVEGTVNGGRGKVHCPLEGNIQGSQSMCSEYDDKSYGYSRASADKLNCAADWSKSKETGNKSSIQESSAIDHCGGVSRSIFGSGNRDVSASSLVEDKRQTQNARGDSENMACSSGGGKVLELDQTVTVASNFIFNLPYLKTRLNQINWSEHYRLSHIDFRSGKRPCNHTTDLSSAIYSHSQQPAFSLLNCQRVDSSPSL